MAAAEHPHDPRLDEHRFGIAGSRHRERALWQVTALTFAAMLLELAVGWWSGSLALTADGWHMGTHALALGGAALAMRLARRAERSTRFAFGGWKIEMLAAYSSALMLLAVALSLLLQAAEALLQPRRIAYEEAMVVALLGLGVNLLSAWLLARRGAEPPDGTDRHAQGQAQGPAHGPAHPHQHEHAHGHAHAGGAHGDANFRAAWLHVVTDALTSVLALVALGGGLWWGWRWLDPAVAVVGALLILRWGWSVLFEAARALVDASSDALLAQQVRAALEADGQTRVADLHVWQVGANAFAAAVSLVADAPLEPSRYRERLRGLRRLRHVTLEVHRSGVASATRRGAEAP